MKSPIKVIIGLVLFIMGALELTVRSSQYVEILDFVSFLGICIGIVLFIVGVDKEYKR